MSYGNIIASGVLTNGQSVTLTERTNLWQISQHASGSAAIATFDGAHDVHLESALHAYTEIYGNYQTLSAAVNTIAYIAYG